jgi:hypothetical protein
MVVPFFFQTYDGEVPPFVGVAVNVTDVPSQIVVALAAIEMPAVSSGFTVMAIVAVEAHCPAVGVNVYVVVVVLSNAGDQVPVMLLFDVVGRAVKLAPEQIAAT